MPIEHASGTAHRLFVFPFSPANAQMNGLRKGKLANGLTYYIYNDGSATGEAQYYLYQNVGAILENDEEMGLAHVLEHLAFNTTDHFPNGVMNFLRSNNLNDLRLSQVLMIRVMPFITYQPMMRS